MYFVENFEASEKIHKDVYDLVEEAKKEAYERGMEDAWKMAKEISTDYSLGGINAEDLKKMFGSAWLSIIFTTISVKEAKEKLDTYHKERKTFCVGDEIIVNSTGEKMIILIVGNKFIKCLTTKHLVTYTCMHESLEEMANDYTKTGRHFDEVEELFKNMKED